MGGKREAGGIRGGSKKQKLTNQNCEPKVATNMNFIVVMEVKI